MAPLIRTAKFRRKHGQPKGSAWESADDQELARSVALLALGEWQHVAEMLRTGKHLPDPPVDFAIDGAIRTLSAPDGSEDWLVAHRDGWVFQAISWMAAVEVGRGPTRAPHIGHAEKGFDGLQLLLNKKKSRAKRLIIFEDKATTNPRKQVHENVWPALALLEAGERDHELRSDLSTLLLQAPGLDTRQAVDRLMRGTANRSYRVAITIGDSHASLAGVNRLFKGYSDVVKGSRFRRRAHVMKFDDLRLRMSEISNLAIQVVEGYR